MGRLTISDDVIELRGGGRKLMVSQVRRVSIGEQGGDFINDWVKVGYGSRGQLPAWLDS